MRFLTALRDALWGWQVLLPILAAGVYFTVTSRGYPLRCAGRWMREPLRGRSAFRGVSTALGGSLGTGNIVGVAVAISTGGPGALFWMWASAFFGMMTVCAENYLAARYRGAPGPLGYLRAVRTWGGLLAGVYAAGCVCSSLAMGNMAQANACAAALESFGLPAWTTGLLLAALLFFVARGGLRVAGRIAEGLVPGMSLVFFLASLGVLFVFRENLPAAVRSVFAGAFSPQAGAGGAAAGQLALREGVSRGVFTNEAGLGSASFAYEDARDKSPRQLGDLGIFQVFLDTLVMCTVTGLCILCCRSPALKGAGLTFFAYESALGPLGGKAVSLCTALFALASQISWCCYGRAAFRYLFGPGRGLSVYCVLAALAAFWGCLLPVEAVFLLGDACNGLMAIPNLAGLFFHRRDPALHFSHCHAKIKGQTGKNDPERMVCYETDPCHCKQR